MLQIVFLLLALSALIAGLFLLRIGLLVVTIRGESMYPTLQHGDRILVLRRWLAGNPRKGQVVVFDLAAGLEEQKLSADLQEACYVKRVVAVAGETFSAKLFANALPEIELAARRKPAQTASQVESWQIPSKHLFVCGDNEEQSIDSRMWGPLPLSNVLGMMVMKLPEKDHTPMPTRSRIRQKIIEGSGHKLRNGRRIASAMWQMSLLAFQAQPKGRCAH